MKSLAVFIASLFLVAACAGIEPLPPRSGGNPLQTDLSGDWVMRGAPERPRSYEQTIRIPPAGQQRDPNMQRRGKPRSGGPSAHVFLTSGKDLKVTQTDYTLFLSFDRALVREYNFGENRMESIGPIEAQRVSGWDGATYVVETMGGEGEVLTETWSLTEDGGVLVRDISIRKGDETSFSTRQVFDRQ